MLMPIAHKLARYETVHLELTPIDEPVPSRRGHVTRRLARRPRGTSRAPQSTALSNGVVMRAVLLTLAGPQPGGLVNRARCARD